MSLAVRMKGEDPHEVVPPGVEKSGDLWVLNAEKCKAISQNY